MSDPILWWPTSYMDEVMPPGRIHPSDWLMRLDDGAWAYGVPLDEVDRVGIEPTRLVEGQVVGFSECETLGDYTMRVERDGTFTWPQGAPPERTTHLWQDEDVLTMSETAEQMAEHIGEWGGVGDYEISALRWGDGTDYRFEIVEGEGRFVEIGPTPRATVVPADAPLLGAE